MIMISIWCLFVLLLVWVSWFVLFISIRRFRGVGLGIGAMVFTGCDLGRVLLIVGFTVWNFVFGVRVSLFGFLWVCLRLVRLFTVCVLLLVLIWFLCAVGFDGFGLWAYCACFFCCV